jgi:hypothetical protein
LVVSWVIEHRSLLVEHLLRTRNRVDRHKGDKTAVGTLAVDGEDPRLMELYRAAAKVSAIFPWDVVPK